MMKAEGIVDRGRRGEMLKIVWKIVQR